MASLFAGTENTEDMGRIYERLEANCPQPSSTSKALWELRRATNISDHSANKEMMLEKAVAILANNGYMTKWFNQCPAASGIGDSSRNRKSSVDLVHWDPSNKRARLVELKWASDDPHYALREIPRYGAAYLFCRIYRDKLPLKGRSMMDARHVSLEVAAPAHYYRGYDLASALAFPKDCDQIPFTDGEKVTQKCNTTGLTPDGRKVRDAFEGLTPAA